MLSVSTSICAVSTLFLYYSVLALKMYTRLSKAEVPFSTHAARGNYSSKKITNDAIC